MECENKTKPSNTKSKIKSQKEAIAHDSLCFQYRYIIRSRNSSVAFLLMFLHYKLGSQYW